MSLEPQTDMRSERKRVFFTNDDTVRMTLCLFTITIAKRQETTTYEGRTWRLRPDGLNLGLGSTAGG